MTMRYSSQTLVLENTQTWCYYEVYCRSPLMLPCPELIIWDGAECVELKLDDDGLGWNVTQRGTSTL